jgi:UTP--glucose-1-phosphate uridylyltransferase
MTEVKKAIILLAGLGTRFLPLSKVVPKELWPLVDRPVVEYIITEAKKSGINEIIFILRAENKAILNYIKPSLKIEKVLKDHKKEKELAELKTNDNFFKDIKFSYVLQKNPLGDGHAILQAEKLVGQEPVAVLFADDVVESKIPVISQIKDIFKTCQKPVVALYNLPEEKLFSYGIADVEKIANRHYKLKDIIEKPAPGNAPSNLAIIGKYILTPEVFSYLKKTKPTGKGEIILANAFQKMLRDGKVVYGHEIEGKWLECGNKLAFLKSNLYLSLNHPKYGPELKKFLKEI